MPKKSLKIALVVLVIAGIVICGDDETRNFLKGKINDLKRG